MARTTLDFTAGLDADELSSLSAPTSVWTAALTTLAEGVKDGKGKYYTFYAIGTWKNASGARTAVRNIEKRGDPLPAVFDLKPVVITPEDGGKKSSVLYAAVLPPEDGEGDDPAEATVMPKPVTKRSKPAED